jgi:hypothetical protein
MHEIVTTRFPAFWVLVYKKTHASEQAISILNVASLRRKAELLAKKLRGPHSNIATVNSLFMHVITQQPVV